MTSNNSSATIEKEVRNKPAIKQEIAFILMHLAPLGMIWTGATTFDWITCAVLYFVRMFFITGGYHRYFSHKSYKTSRFFQFILAFMAQTSAQKGALWWAAHHREHHRHSDTAPDPHSMKLYGFWYSHIGWILGPDYKETKYGLIQDFAKYKELVWLNKYHWVPGLVLGFVVTAVGAIVNGGSITTMFEVPGGLSSLFCGFFLSTVILYHGTFSINSIMHRIGKKRYETGDESRNSLILALVTLGEGWHNNHHYYMVSTRQGFFWWEIDITYYILKALSFVGIVWDIKEVPHHIKNSRSLEEAREKARKIQNAKASIDKEREEKEDSVASV
jgi:stearoyl-CoA desaturase (delta-9 desaturase)